VDLAALCASVVDALEPVAQAKDVRLVCGRSSAVLVTADRGWMERLLLNLLDNAIKFTPPGGMVTVTVTREGNAARLTVRDTGVGMAADVLPHLFERFYRADSARSSQTDGVGLGLSLVKWIAGQHGATINVVSRPGAGSTFTVELPLQVSPRWPSSGQDLADADRQTASLRSRKISSEAPPQTDEKSADLRY